MDQSIIETNIFRFSLNPSYKKFDHVGLSKHLKEKHKILINPTFEKDAIRLVTHRDVGPKDVEYLVKALKQSL